MSSDWNWFFSSFAQSIGALVGVLIAFVVTVISARRTKLEANAEYGRNLVLEGERLKLALRARHFERYNQLALELLESRVQAAFSNEYGNELELRTPEEYFDEIGSKAFLSRSELIGFIRKVVEEERSGRARKAEVRAEKLRREASKREYGAGSFMPSIEFSSAVPYIEPLPVQLARNSRRDAERLERRTELDAIEALRVAVNHNISSIRSLLPAFSKDSDRSRLTNKLLGAATILFCFGVIWPLSLTPIPIRARIVAPWTFLDADEPIGLIRLTMLGIASLIFGSLLFALFRENSSTRLDPALLSDLNAWTAISNYSPYFAESLSGASQPSPDFEEQPANLV